MDPEARLKGQLQGYTKVIPPHRADPNPPKTGLVHGQLLGTAQLIEVRRVSCLSFYLPIPEDKSSAFSEVKSVSATFLKLW